MMSRMCPQGREHIKQDKKPEYEKSLLLLYQAVNTTYLIDLNTPYRSVEVIDTLLTNEATSDQVKMNDPNITMEEYIRLEEEKACRHGKMYNWKTATYGKIWGNEDVHDLESVEIEFPAIVFNDMITS
ncbi:hypothetical protein Tco_1219780 [Tanacetum coccineum]